MTDEPLYPGFKIIDLVRIQHACQLPSVDVIQGDRLGPNTILECLECETKHRLENSQKDGWVWVRLLR